MTEIVPSGNGVLEILSGMAVVSWRSGDDRGVSPPAASRRRRSRAALLASHKFCKFLSTPL